MQFDEFGNTSPGINKISIEDFEDHFVKGFQNSKTRHRNLEGLISYLSLPFFKTSSNMFTRIWLDGSFCTSKNDPNDIDGILFINPFISGSSLQIANNFMNYFNNVVKNQGNAFFSDLYVVIDIDELPKPDGSDENYYAFYREMDYQFKYWMGQFCFDRSRNPKGIFELDYKGGEFHV